MTQGIISKARKEFHKSLISTEILTFSPFNKYNQSVIASNADSGQSFSVELANQLAQLVSESAGCDIINRPKKKAGQTLGNEFEGECSKFIQNTFLCLESLRPGKWEVSHLKNRSSGILGDFDQYSHLAKLGELASKNSELKSFLGESYMVAPDVVITRKPETDEAINKAKVIVDDSCSSQAMLRAVNHDNFENPQSLLHASISCKYTMRSDRAQNTRTECLTLIRNRKGRTPHIIAITAEPTPSRISSLALGTGDLDCVYHVALYELEKSLRQLNRDDALDLLNIMTKGKRLKDISDLPLDLAI